ncbi:hypothetical protein [Streptococcus dysgalactiae]|uniref:hypothetical protein n=1 Tax=Streptococcus dysgalactiae TaxID=1334 RepID=UPI003F767E9F
MKRKLVGLIVLAISTVFLVACSTNSLNGKYYKVYDGKKTLVLEINGKDAYINLDGKKVITKIDKESKIIFYEDYGVRTLKYEISRDGEFSYFGDIAGKDILYKEGSKSLEKALRDKE